MTSRPIALSVLMFLAASMPASANAADTTDWFTLSLIRTGYSTPHYLVVEGTFDDDPDGCNGSFGHQMVIQASTPNFESIKTILLMAMASGREVRLYWTGCYSYWRNATQAYIR